MRASPRGWPGKLVAMDSFGRLLQTKAGNVFILVLIDHFSRWAKPIALKKAAVPDIVLAL